METVTKDISHLKKTIRDMDVNQLTEDSNILSKTKIKNVFENIRSVLDYSAKDIFENISKGSASRIYFPYRKNETDFDHAINSNFGNLKATDRDVYDSLLSIQDFSSSKKWLYAVCEFTNQNKHDSLSKQYNEISGSGYTLGNDAIRLENNEATVVFSNISVGGQPLGKENKDIVIQQNTSLSQLKEQLPDLIKVDVINGKARVFVFIDKVKYDLFELLDTALLEISRYIRSLYTLLGGK